VETNEPGAGGSAPGPGGRFQHWAAGLPPWALLLVAAAAWGAVYAVCEGVRILCLALSLTAPAPAKGIWWAWNLALVGLAVALVPRPRSRVDRFAGPLLYACAFGPPGAACYVVIRAGGIAAHHPLLRTVWAMAEWLPDRLRDLLGAPVEPVPVPERAGHGPEGREETPPRVSGRLCALVLGAVCAAAFVFYWPSITSVGFWLHPFAPEEGEYLAAFRRLGPWRWSEYLSPFVFDRYFPHAQGCNYYRPVMLLSFAMDYAAWGERPWVWHLHSVLIHLGAVLLLYWTVSLTARDRRAGLAAAALYAVLPDNAHAVSRIGIRYELLCGFFALGALACFALLCMGKSKWLWPAGLALYLLALGAKEVAVVVSPLLAGWVVFGATGSRRLRFGVAASLLGVLAIYMGWRAGIRSLEFGPSWAAPSWQGMGSVRSYLGLLWPPATQIVSALQAGSVGFQGIHLVVLAAALGLLRRNWRPAGFWFAWKAALLMPTVGFPAMGLWRLYMPSMGAAALSGVLAAEALATMRSWPRPLRWVPIAVVAVFFVLFARALPGVVGQFVP